MNYQCKQQNKKQINIILGPNKELRIKNYQPCHFQDTERACISQKSRKTTVKNG